MSHDESFRKRMEARALRSQSVTLEHPELREEGMREIFDSPPSPSVADQLVFNTDPRNGVYDKHDALARYARNRCNMIDKRLAVLEKNGVQLLETAVDKGEALLLENRIKALESAPKPNLILSFIIGAIAALACVALVAVLK